MDLPLLLGILPQVLLDGLILGFMYALIALGYTMVYGVLEFINFAHSEIFIVGAFVGVEIMLGLKGLQIEQHAQEVMAYCAQLQKDFGKFKDDFELVGTHLGRAHNKFLDAEKRLGRFETKLEQAAESPDELETPAEAHELPRAADAA